MEASQKSPKLIVAMDACELRITIEWAKHFENENVDLDAKLHSKVDDLRKSTKSIERLQLNVQKLPYQAPITQK